MAATLGKTIREIRVQKGWSQGRICKILGWERSYMSDLERDEIKNPSFETIAKLMWALDYSMDQFVASIQNYYNKILKEENFRNKLLFKKNE